MAEDKPLSFLEHIREFRDFTLTITELELKKKIEARGIYSDRTVDDSGSINYWLLTEQGENVNVMFRRSGECSGIQRMQPVPKDYIRKQIGDAAYRKWVDDNQKKWLSTGQPDREGGATRK